MTTEFTWTKCESNLNWKELNESFNFFRYFWFLTPDFGIKCQFCNLSFHTSIFVQLDSSNMMTEPPKYEVSYLWTFSTVPPTTVKTFTFLCHGFSHDNIHEFSHANQTLWVPWIFPCNLPWQWAHNDADDGDGDNAGDDNTDDDDDYVGCICKLRGSCKNINRVTMRLPPFLSGISSATCFTN